MFTQLLDVVDLHTTEYNNILYNLKFNNTNAGNSLTQAHYAIIFLTHTFFLLNVLNIQILQIYRLQILKIVIKLK